MKSNTLLFGRRRSSRLVPFSILAATAMAMSVASPVLAATVINTDIPVTTAVVNPCNAEFVPLGGTEHFIFRVTYDNNGGGHVGIHENIQVTGTGDKGNSYVGNLANLYEGNAKVGSENTGMLSFDVISKGSAPNFLMHGVFHVTINPDGTVTAQVADWTAECRG